MLKKVLLGLLIGVTPLVSIGDELQGKRQQQQQQQQQQQAGQQQQGGGENLIDCHRRTRRGCRRADRRAWRRGGFDTNCVVESNAPGCNIQ